MPIPSSSSPALAAARPGGNGSGLASAWNQVAALLPKLGAFVLIVVATYLAARLARRYLDRVLRGVGVDRWADRTPLRGSLVRGGRTASDVLARVGCALVWLFGLSTAFGVWGPNPIGDYLDAIVSYLPKVGAATVILAVTAWLASVVRGVLRDMLGGLSYAGLVAGVAAWLVAGFGIVAALRQLEIAPALVTALVYAVLAACVGVVVVGVGGGLIEPMRHRWDRVLRAAESEAPRVREHARAWHARRAAGAAGPPATDVIDPYPAEPTVPAPAPAPDTDLPNQSGTSAS